MALPADDGESTISVLHVDDDREFVEMTKTFLHRQTDALEVESVTTVEQGLDRLATGAVDCIVSDFDMPGGSGIDFLETVRAEHGDLPFVLFTGKGSEELASEAIAAGVSDYLQKNGQPEQFELLAKRINNLVGRWRAQRERQRQLEAIETAQEGISILNDAGEFTYVNHAYAELYGYEPAEMIGHHWELVYPDEEIDAVRTELLPTVASDGRWHGTTTGLRADGETFVEDHIVAQTAQGGLICTVRDITDQRERELELQRKSQAMDAAPIGIVLTDPAQPDNPIVWANDGFERLTGYDREDILGRNCRFLQGEATEAEPVSTLREAIDDGAGVTVELRNYRADGTEFWNRVSIAPVRDEHGTVLNFVGFQQDITATKERQRELAFFEQLVETMGVGVGVYGDDGRYAYVNEAYATMLETDRDTLVGKALWELNPEFDRDRFAAYWNSFEPGETRVAETRHRLGGTEVPVQTVTTRQRIDETTYHFGTITDITERKSRQEHVREMRQRFERFGRSVSDAFFLVTRDYTETLYVNPRVERIYGISQAAASEDPNSWLRYVHPEDRARLRDGIRAQQESTDWPIHQEFRVRHPTRGLRWIHSRLDVITDEDGIPVQIAGVATDITERKHREQALEHQTEQLKEFTGIVSHDLRNPMNVATGRLEMASQACDSEHLEAVERAHERMQELIDDLLELAHSGSHVTEMDSLHLGELVTECWENVATEAAEVDVASDGRFEAEDGRVKQLLENLFRNAVEHAGAAVTVRVGMLERAHGFFVEDNGPGIPEEHRTSIFESQYSTSEDGTGFGLAIVKQIVDAHGWEITVTDGTDGGARFEITGVRVHRR